MKQKQYHTPLGNAKPKQDLTRQAIRTCLTCLEKFNSWGPGNRRCTRCRELEDYKSGGVAA